MLTNYEARRNFLLFFSSNFFIQNFFFHANGAEVDGGRGASDAAPATCCEHGHGAFARSRLRRAAVRHNRAGTRPRGHLLENMGGGEDGLPADFVPIRHPEP